MRVSGHRTEQNVFVMGGVRFPGKDPLEPASRPGCPPDVPGHPAVMVAHMRAERDAPLSQIGLAHNGLGLLPHTSHHRQQHGHQQGDNRDHHQQLDERECFWRLGRRQRVRDARVVFIGLRPSSSTAPYMLL